jgi:hypothetical protein
MNIVIDTLMGWIENCNILLQMVDYLAFVKASLHMWSPKDLATSTPTNWCIPMACQPLPLGFYNLEFQTPYL